jgi:hypothetical protein
MYALLEFDTQKTLDMLLTFGPLHVNLTSTKHPLYWSYLIFLNLFGQFQKSLLRTKKSRLRTFFSTKILNQNGHV